MNEQSGGTAVIDPKTGQRVHERTTTGGRSNEFEGWYCLSNVPWTCPGCRRTFLHEQVCLDDGAHRIVVWPELDDPELLKYAQKLLDRGEDPRVVPYERGLGLCVSYYALESAGIILAQ